MLGLQVGWLRQELLARHHFRNLVFSPRFFTAGRDGRCRYETAGQSQVNRTLITATNATRKRTAGADPRRRSQKMSIQHGGTPTALFNYFQENVAEYRLHNAWGRVHAWLQHIRCLDSEHRIQCVRNDFWGQVRIWPDVSFLIHYS